MNTTVVCRFCAKEMSAKPTPKGVRLPPGWKRLEGREVCKACWQERYRLRAVIFPIAEVLEGGSWQEFLAALRDCWGRSTNLANWAVTELAKADHVRQVTDEKLPPMPQVNLYQLWQGHYRRQEWTGAAVAANSVLRSVEQKYRKARLEVVWTGTAVLPRHRYPVPYPVHNQAWQAAYREYTGKNGQVSKVPIVSVPLSGKIWILRLRGGAERRRQLGSFAQIVSGAAIQGELALYRIRSSSGSHRSDMQQRQPGGGARVNYRILCKLVAWLPKPLTEPIQLPPPVGMSIEDQLRKVQQRELKGTLQVRTGHNALWIATAPEREEPWLLHANYVRRWIKVHRWKLQQISDDTKAERRRPKRNRIQTNDHLDKLTHRQHCRLDTFCHRASRMLANFAYRCQVAEVDYDDRNKQYFSEFPWYKLKLLLQQKLDEYGIHFITARAEAMEAEDEANGNGSD